MATSAIRIDERIADVRVSESALEVWMQDGRRLAAPLTWFPRLAGASREALERWEISSAGYGIHWPDLDEDIGIAGLLRSSAHGV